MTWGSSRGGDQEGRGALGWSLQCMEKYAWLVDKVVQPIVRLLRTGGCGGGKAMDPIHGVWIRNQVPGANGDHDRL